MKRYSEEQIKQANSMNLVSYLQSNGYQLIPEGRQFKLAEHDSLYIRDNQWYWFSQGKGGKTLDFLTQYEGKSFVDAMRELVGEPMEVGDNPQWQQKQPRAQSEPLRAAEGLMLPVPAQSNDAVFAYLKSRGIDARKVKACIDEGTIYQTEMFWQLNEEGKQGSRTRYLRYECQDASVYHSIRRDAEGRNTKPDRDYHCQVNIPIDCFKNSCHGLML